VLNKTGLVVNERRFLWPSGIVKNVVMKKKAAASRRSVRNAMSRLFLSKRNNSKRNQASVTQAAMLYIEKEPAID
jgi:hypothetical protein